ncbi:nuclear transport factor 2 family protein [Micromonospora arborensis]|uniref:nuclear transport factor 2 family protein n=1 Tax=Micromonospora arborensis TaxID=2116518 RepID=UPI00340F24AD
MMQKAGRVVLVASLALSMAACSSETDTPGAAPAPDSSGITTVPADSPPPAPAGEPAAGVDKAAVERVAQRFVDAANAGDEDGVRSTFAPNAQFDSVGRIYPSRDAIMDRFLIPEVLRAGGRYKAVGSRWNGERYIVDYEFSTGGGGREVFYYDYLIRDGVIHDVVGRYN